MGLNFTWNGIVCASPFGIILFPILCLCLQTDRYIYTHNPLVQRRQNNRRGQTTLIPIPFHQPFISFTSFTYHHRTYHNQYSFPKKSLALFERKGLMGRLGQRSHILSNSGQRGRGVKTIHDLTTPAPQPSQPPTEEQRKNEVCFRSHPCNEVKKVGIRVMERMMFTWVVLRLLHPWSSI